MPTPPTSATTWRRPRGRPSCVDYYQYVMTDYFETMGIPIVQGRGFRASDAVSGPVVIVNEAMVNLFWKDANPIGQTLKPGFAAFAQVPDFTVIGVAKDVKQGGVDKKTGTEIYTLVDQTALMAAPVTFAPGTMNVVLRTTLPPATLRTSIEGVLREADPSVPIVRLRDMNGVFEESIRRPRLLAQLLADSPDSRCYWPRSDLRRAVVRRGGAPPRDRHPHGTRCGPGQRPCAGDEAGPGAHDRGYPRRIGGGLRAQSPDRVVAVWRRADRSDHDGGGHRDDYSGGVRRLLAAGVARIAGRPQRRPT